MKFFALAAAASALSLERVADVPNYAFNSHMASGAGFVQLTACQRSGVADISCAPHSLVQWSPLEVKTAPKDLPFCTGTNGPVGVNCKRPACDGANGPMDGPASSGCIRDEPAKIPHYNEDPTAGRPYGTTGDQTRSDYVPSPAVYDQVPVQGSKN